MLPVVVILDVKVGWAMRNLPNPVQITMKWLMRMYLYFLKSLTCESYLKVQKTIHVKRQGIHI